MSTFNDIRIAAAAAGRYRLIRMTSDGGEHDLDLFVRIDQRLDERFLATCAETGETLRVNGWLWSLHDAAEDRAALAAEYGFDWREHHPA